MNCYIFRRCASYEHAKVGNIFIYDSKRYFLKYKLQYLKLKGLAMIFAGQENPWIVFRSKEKYIKTSNKISVKKLWNYEEIGFFGKFLSWEHFLVLSCVVRLKEKKYIISENWRKNNVYMILSLKMVKYTTEV